MNKIVIAVIIIAAVLAGAYVLLRGPQSSSREVATPAVSEQPSGGTTPQPPVAQAPAREAGVRPENSAPREEYIVTYTDAGYSPANLNLKKGEAVTFKNQSSQSLWTASDVHPSHRAYSGTSLDEHCPDTTNTAFDACRGVLPGQSWSFTFNKVGTWGYHNHLSPGDRGAIVVE